MSSAGSAKLGRVGSVDEDDKGQGADGARGGPVASGRRAGAGADGRPWSEHQEAALRMWIALARCYTTFSKAIAAKVQEYGLTTPQFGVLEALYHLGPLSLGELADKLLVTGGNVTYVMDRLEAQGLVYRDRSPEDRRVIQAKLTEEGSELVREVFPGHAEYVEHLSRHLDGDELDTLRSLLKALGKGVGENDL